MANYNPTPKPENLQPPWPKGQSGNTKGSSAKQRLTTALLKLIEEKGLDDPFVQVGMKAALKGDFKFWSYIFDRVDGKMVQPEQEPDAEPGLIEEADERRRKRKADRPPD